MIFGARLGPLLILVAIATAAVRAAPAPPPPEHPLDWFFGNPAIAQVRFSPNGRYLAALVPHDRRMNLVMMDLERKTKSLVTGFKDYGITSYGWANNDRLVMLMDDDGDEDYIAFAIDRDGKNFDRLDRSSEIIRRDRHDPRRMLVYSNPTVRDHPDPCWLDVRTGKITSLAHNPGNVTAWVLDHNNVARIGLTANALATGIIYRERDGAEWRELAQFADGERRWRPLAFDGDNRTLYIASDVGRRTFAIYRYDTATLARGELVYEDPDYDIEDVIWSEGRQRVVGVRWEAERPRVHYFDEAFGARQRVIDAALPDTFNTQIEATEDGTRIVIFARSDREPGVYYTFDAARKKIEELAVVRPAIDPGRMAPMKPITYQARDGLAIHGYLTLPLGREPRALPLLIHPHGGPFGIRDKWGYNSEVQFLANRGFAVLQPNYRGSGGYGDDFERKGYRGWGRVMQDDLTDAVKWAVAQGIADPNRVGIIGGSYGGYAVMAGLTFTPELYRAGVNYVGVTDLTLIASQRRQSTRGREWTRTRIGDAIADAAELRARSPVLHAEQIRAPVLMAYGRSDPRVTREHGDDMRAALLKHGKPLEFILENNEGHGFRKEEKSIAYYGRIEQFLKEHLLGQTGAVKVGPTKVIDLPAKAGK